MGDEKNGLRLALRPTPGLFIAVGVAGLFTAIIGVARTASLTSKDRAERQKVTVLAARSTGTLQRLSSLRREIGASHSSKPAIDAGNRAVLAIADLSRRALADGIRIENWQIVGGALQAGTQTVTRAPKPSRHYPGLRVVSITVSGAWPDLPSLEDWVARAKTDEAPVVSMDVRSGVFTAKLHAYGK